MNLTNLYHFLLVAQELNITRVAKKLYISQQSLSEQIAHLEEDYNIKLFERTPRLKLTYAGERMVDFAEQVLNLDRQFKNEMADVSLENRGTLSVGARVTHSSIILPELISLFSIEHPNIQLHIASERTLVLSRMLAAGQLDLAFGSARLMGNPNFVSIPLSPDNYYVVIPENILCSVFSLTKENIAAGAVPDYHKIGNTPLLMFGEDSITRSATNYFLDCNGIFSPNILIECQNVDPLLAACSHGLGITFTSGKIFHHFVETTRLEYPLYGFPFETATTTPSTVICYRHDRPLSRAGHDFIELATKLL